MAKVILITGFPGSGKSTYGSNLRDSMSAVDYVDDYHENARNGNPAFESGRQYGQLIAGLKRGETWIASDIEWCRPQKRREVEVALRAAVPQVVIEWHFLATDEEICRQRVKLRGRNSADDELRKIERLLPHYHAPPESKIVHGD